MSDLIGSLDNYYSTSKVKSSSSTDTSAGSTDLSMTDFLSLMVSQFQNQSIDNTASTTDMMNQLVQMSVMQAVSNVNDVAQMLYTSSLVGKQVTISQTNDAGKTEKVEGTVTATGKYNDSQVIFVDGKRYDLSDMIAIGTLPSTDSSTSSSK